MTDWQAWHREYDDPDSDLSRRRRSVQRQVEHWLDERDEADAAGGERLQRQRARPARGARAPARDARRVSARLLETDDELAGAAESYAAAHGLDRIDVRRADAGITDSYLGAVPADLVMMCGVFGNISDDDIRRTVRTLPALCAPGATVIWTRGRFTSGDLAPTIGTWLAEAGFDEVAMDAPDDTTYRVGAHRLAGEVQDLVPGGDSVSLRPMTRPGHGQKVHGPLRWAGVPSSAPHRAVPGAGGGRGGISLGDERRLEPRGRRAEPGGPRVAARERAEPGAPDLPGQPGDRTAWLHPDR